MRPSGHSEQRLPQDKLLQLSPPSIFLCDLQQFKRKKASVVAEPTCRAGGPSFGHAPMGRLVVLVNWAGPPVEPS